MKQITNITINTAAMQAGAVSRSYTVFGDPGAVFSMTITNSNNYYYNFPQNTVILNSETQSVPSAVFAATPVRLNPVTIGSSGQYTGVISFPAIVVDDYYYINLIAEGHYETKMSNNLGGNFSYLLPKITRFKNTTVTFSLVSAGSNSVYTYPNNVTATGIDSNAFTTSPTQKFSISWPVSINTGNFVIANQPTDKDFEFTTTRESINSDGLNLELTDISGLSVGMGVSGTGIDTGVYIKYIYKGFYNKTKSTDIFPVYDIPLVPNDDGTGLEESSGGTIVISVSSVVDPGTTITLTGKGADASKGFNNTDFKVKNFKVVLDDITTTTDAAVSNSTTIPIASTDGIKAVEGVTFSGIGVVGTPHVDSISAGVSITASAAQTIENGQTITFTGSSRSATITADVEVVSYGDDNLTLTLALDNILTVS